MNDLTPSIIKNSLTCQANYDSEKQQVWAHLIRSFSEQLHCLTCFDDAYLEAAQWILCQKNIPSIDEINNWLLPTGWSAVLIDGYVPIIEYQALQSRKIFPVACDIRRLEDLEHSAAPDFFHDLVGHLPMMFNKNYRELVFEWASRGTRSRPSQEDESLATALGDLIHARQSNFDSSVIAELTRRLEVCQGCARRQRSACFQLQNFYTWVMEFGILSTGENRNIIGGAALSSPGEMKRITNGETELRQFSDKILEKPVDYTRYQSELFVAIDFDAFFCVLRSIKGA